MERFAADPDDPRARIDISGRRDEIGRAEVELDRMSAFHEAVAAMPTEEREAVSLTYYHGWKQLEIAKLFGVSFEPLSEPDLEPGIALGR